MCRTERHITQATCYADPTKLRHAAMCGFDNPNRTRIAERVTCRRCLSLMARRKAKRESLSAQ